jgi:aspartyl-tRNA(Asn)/glutamyl-tRNA(Gln) amidotransferase subunit B
MQRFVNEYGLSAYSAGVLTVDRNTADYFEEAVSSTANVPPLKISNWLSGSVFSLLNERNISIDEIKITPDGLAQLISKIENGEISASSGKVVLDEMFESGRSSSEIIDERGLRQMSDLKELEKVVARVVVENPQQLEIYLNGKASLLEWFFGQVMRETQGRADPKLVRKTLESHLKGVEESHSRE